MAIDRVKTKANAEKLLKAGKVPETIRELQKLADDNPRDIQVLNQIGQLHLRLGNKEHAVPCFLKVADLFSKSGFFTKAVASLKIVTREAPDNLSAWEMLASLSEQQGFAREAWSAYEKVAEIYARTGNLNGVIGVQTKLLDLDPDNLKVQVQLGDNLIKAGRKDDGVKHYLKAGGKLVAQGHIKEAARMYERALQLDPTNFNALESAVKTHLAHQQGDLALQLLDSLLERAPTAEGVLLLKADILTETHQFSAAEAVCRAVVASKPDSPGAMFRLVRALVMQQRIDDASALVAGWLRSAGPSRAQEVEALYEEILRFSAGHVPSLQGLVEVSRLSGKEERLVKALSSLAESASAQGPLPAARDALQELLQIDPNNLQLAEKLHGVERKMGLSTQPDGERPGSVAAKATLVEVPQAEEPPPPEPPKPPSEPDFPPRLKPNLEEPQIDLDVEVEQTGEAEIEIDMDDLSIEAADFTASLSRTAAGQASEIQESISPETLEEEEPPPAPAASPKETAPFSAREGDEIRDQLTEAEVFLKYGLVEKAIAELQGVLKKAPDHVHAHQKLIAIFRNQKKNDKLVRQILKLAAVFRDQGDDETSAHLVDEARSIDPNHKALIAWGPGGIQPFAPPSAWDQALKAPQEVKIPTPPPVELEVEVSAPEKPSRPTEVEPDEVVLSLEEEEPDAAQPSAGELSPVGEDALTPAGGQEVLQAQAAQEVAPPVEEGRLDLDLSSEVESVAGISSPEAELSEQLEEAEFYLNQELFGEAQKALKGLEAKWPDFPKVQKFRQKLAGLLPANMQPAPAPEPPVRQEEELPLEVLEVEEERPNAGPGVSLDAAPEDAVAALEERTPPTEEVVVFEEPPPAAEAVVFEEPVPEPAPEVDVPVYEEPPPQPIAEREKVEGRTTATGSGSKARMKVSLKDLLPEEPEVKAEEPLFKEDEYYDLASELGAALDGLQTPEESLFDEDGKSPEEMSFEEVFEEFKKGVEKKVGEEDYATHYNLGIAYKEMELLDEAIGEFQLAARAPQYYVECCSMLGICFRQKGLTELAEKWYLKGIAAPGFADDVYVGLKYDLADCMVEQGRPEEARTLFKEVYAIQAGYRDVKARIKQLG